MRYADYDGAGGTDFDCSQAPAGACGTLVPGQPFLLADADGNGLIEIRDLAMLHNMRYNLAGTSYKSSTIAIGNTFGCPAAGCNGYELTGDLDFDADGDGTSWSDDGDGGYLLDAGDSRAPYFVVDEDGAGGWQPISDAVFNPFIAVFDGNGYAIRNLAIRRKQQHIGLFGALGSPAAIRNIGLVANLADSSDEVGEASIGGLAGSLRGGSITASYATGPVVGRGVRIRLTLAKPPVSYVGGLVGLIAPAHQGADIAGSITASYATGPVVSGTGSHPGGANHGGGLVGWQQAGSITASYATGPVVSGGRALDSGGGLVGFQRGGSILASYATGLVVGGSSDDVGSLVGEESGGSITASYGVGAVEGGTANDLGAPPSGVSDPTQLTASNAGASWNAAANNSLGAWDFGTASQPPAVKYADYDGSGTVFNCNQAPAGACDTALPGQQVPTIEDRSTALSGGEVSLAGADDDPLSVGSWHWRQLEGPLVSLTATDSRELTFTAPTIDGSVVLLFRRTDTADGRRALFPLIVKPADADGDGLIEIDDLAMLHNMRHDLTGASYKSSAASAGNSTGCPALGCNGYELVGDLDFDADGDGTGWTGDSTDGYLLDDGDSRAPYFVVNASNAGGWLPIGDSLRPFVATFEGNGYSIRNLGIRSTAAQIGLFGTLGGGAAVRNLGLIANLAEHSGTAIETDIGGLAGQQSGGSLITASYATGPVQGGAGNRDVAGGLVGRQSGGSITASHATGPVDGGAGNLDVAGGLVGWQSGGSIVASHATGAVDGGSGDEDMVGGLVGEQRQGASITASYASGAVRGGSGAEDRVGGLVGSQGGLVRASYATGDAAGGSGIGDKVGGLAGAQPITGIILASYATGAADGGGAPSDSVGGLLGSSQGGAVTASYGVGEILGGGLLGSAGSVAGPNRTLLKDLFTSTPEWNVASSGTRGAWHNLNNDRLPVLGYADYDGAGGSEFDCSQFPAGACGTLLPRQALLGADGPAYLTASSAASVTLSVTAAGPVPRGAFASWSWRQVEGVDVTLADADTPEALFIMPDSGERLVFEVTAVDDNGDEYTDFVTLLLRPRVDRDQDGLIEIDDLTMLHNMRNNMAGTAYESGTIGVADSAGCPAATGCFGYELSGNLDFDTDGDGSQLDAKTVPAATASMPATAAPLTSWSMNRAPAAGSRSATFRIPSPPSLTATATASATSASAAIKNTSDSSASPTWRPSAISAWSPIWWSTPATPLYLARALWWAGRGRGAI